MSFYLVTASTIRLVGDSLFADTVKAGMTSVSELSSVLSQQYPHEGADTFYQRLIQAARSGGGRLLVVDMDAKVQYDTFDEQCGTRLALAEIHTILDGELESDYGFHQVQDGSQQAPSVFDPLTGRDINSTWVGCFVSALVSGWRRTGALVMIASVQDTVDSLTSMRDQMLGIFGIALAVVLVMAGIISSIVTKPVAELSAGIERMSEGDYSRRVHVPGKG